MGTIDSGPPIARNFMVLVVMIDSAATCADIDARAVGKRSLVFANISKKAKFEQ